MRRIPLQRREAATSKSTRVVRVPMSGRTQTLKKFLHRWGPLLPLFAVGGYGSWNVGVWAGESLARWERERRKREYAQMEERIQKRSEEILEAYRADLLKLKGSVD